MGPAEAGLCVGERKPLENIEVSNKNLQSCSIASRSFIRPTNLSSGEPQAIAAVQRRLSQMLFKNAPAGGSVGVSCARDMVTSKDAAPCADGSLQAVRFQFLVRNLQTSFYNIELHI